MIGPEEIRQQALKWWKPFLQSYITKEVFFPKQIDRIGKVKPGQITRQFETLQQEMELLYKASKNETGAGYLIKTAGRNFRRSGTHDLPDTIEFETAEDYLYFIGKKREWKLFLTNHLLLSEKFPQLNNWLVENSLSLTLPDKDWQGIIEVCQYFLANPRPHLYLRQLPISVHTKFIEENSTVLQSLLDFLIADHVRDLGQKRMAERYFLKHDEPLVRIRILDEQLYIHRNIADISIRLSDFEKTDWACTNVIITENKMNFLSLPQLPSSIALWSGGGFNVSYLKSAGWLTTKCIYYWGDIDEHGFQILHQLRSYFPHTKSVMMDQATYDHFKEYAGQGKFNPAEQLNHLSKDEAELYTFLKGQPRKNRLEQEKISHSYVADQFRKMIT